MLSFGCMFWGLRLRFLGSPSPNERNPRTAVGPIICIAPMAFIKGFYRCLCWSRSPALLRIQHSAVGTPFAAYCMFLWRFIWLQLASLSISYRHQSMYLVNDVLMNQGATDRFQIKHSKSMVAIYIDPCRHPSEPVHWSPIHLGKRFSCALHLGDSLYIHLLWQWNMVRMVTPFQINQHMIRWAWFESCIIIKQ